MAAVLQQYPVGAKYFSTAYKFLKSRNMSSTSSIIGENIEFVKLNIAASAQKRQGEVIKTAIPSRCTYSKWWFYFTNSFL